MTASLIADGGSTKVEWICIYKDSTQLPPFSTKGFNAAQVSDTEALEYFQSVREFLPQDLKLTDIHYYGAGCATPQICARIQSAIQNIWTDASVEVGSDMLGSARSLLGRKPGIAAILGTGSNSALYDGKNIISNIPPLGYVLGDEGSGTALGKKLLGDIFKRLAPEEISNAFFTKYKTNMGEVIENVYRKPGANAYIASFVPFIGEYIDHPYLHGLAKECFTIFLERNIIPYSVSRDLPVNFTGSIAVVFSDILKEAAADLGLRIDKIIGNPILGLVKFHTNDE